MTAKVGKNDIYVLILTLIMIGAMSCYIIGFAMNNTILFLVGAILTLSFGITLMAFIFSRIGDVEKRLHKLEKKQ